MTATAILLSRSIVVVCSRQSEIWNVAEDMRPKDIVDNL